MIYQRPALQQAIERGLPPLDQIPAPSIDLGSLVDLQGTLQLLQEVGALD